MMLAFQCGWDGTRLRLQLQNIVQKISCCCNKQKTTTEGWNLEVWQIKRNKKIEVSVKHISIAAKNKSCILWPWFVRSTIIGWCLTWREAVWRAPTVGKQPLVGSIHVRSCQYCDRQDAEWHCHQRCQRPVTFAPVVWEWWRRGGAVRQAHREVREDGKIKGVNRKKEKDSVSVSSASVWQLLVVND